MDWRRRGLVCFTTSWFSGEQVGSRYPDDGGRVNEIGPVEAMVMVLSIPKVVAGIPSHIACAGDDTAALAIVCRWVDLSTVDEAIVSVLELVQPC